MCCSQNCLENRLATPSPFLVRGARMFAAQVADTGALATLGQVGCGWRSPEFLWYQTSPSGVTFGLLGLGNAYQSRQYKHMVPLWPREGHIYLKKNSSVYSAPLKHSWRVFLWRLEQSCILVAFIFFLFRVEKRWKDSRSLEENSNIIHVANELTHTSSIPTSKRPGSSSMKVAVHLREQWVKLCWMFSVCPSSSTLFPFPTCFEPHDSVRGSPTLWLQVGFGQRKTLARDWREGGPSG